MTIIKNQSAAEEITQETFYKAMTSKKQFEGRSDEFTYLCAIAKRLAADEYRRGAKHTELSETELPTVDDFSESVHDSDAALRIHMVLHDLPEPYKEVFQLRIFGELPFSQIGIIFGKTENWARVTYHRARLKIQERMDEND